MGFESKLVGTKSDVVETTLANLGSAQNAGDGAERVVSDAGGSLVKSIKGKFAPIGATYNNSLAVIGDSFTANAYYKSATAEEWNGKGYLTHAMALSGYRLKLTNGGMCAVGGSGVTGNINGVKFDTQLTTAIATGAKELLVMGGINDCNSDVSPDVTIAAYKALLDRAVMAGMRVWVCTQPTQGSQFTSAYTIARQGAQLQVQEWLRQYCQRQSPDNIVLIDCAQTCTDSSSTTASYKSGYTSDYLHPNNAGAYAIGKKIAEVWNKIIPECGSLICSNADNTTYSALSKNILTNGCFINSAGGLATGFTTSVTGSGVVGTPTVTARADGVGNNQNLPMTFSAAGDTCRLSTAAISGFTNGDSLYAECEVTISTPVNFRGVRLFFQVAGNLVSRTATVNQKDDILDRAVIEGCTYIFRSPVITYDASVQGATHTAQAIIIATAQGAGSCTLSVGRMAIKKVA